MELTGLIRIEQAAESLIARAIAHLESADPEAASADLIQALALRRTPFAQHLFCFAQWLASVEGADATSLTHINRQLEDSRQWRKSNSRF
ncbi:hypothetical protein [uncultured Thiocystis sp.]|uniref:hypothetical protein n=1 Tax=uncultured Thiocystis sp. TaxID=1202134 RepID=UPI0025CF65E0|nr:hypothetical protein [uncultured Thiocystis sp.]